ncbi:hypothetical protein ACLKA6_000953 [Drosophila palustris]
MFQNISFTFLCALAFISWTVLCYLHFIAEEQKKSDDYNIEIYTERSHFANDIPQYCPVKSSQTNFISRAFELLVNYGLILAATVVLSKVLQFLELEAMSYLQREEQAATLLVQDSFPMIAQQPIENSNSNWNSSSSTESVNQLELPPSTNLQDNLELREQLDDLEARCRELLQELRTVSITSSSATTSNDNDNDELDNSKQSKSSLTSTSSTDDEENSGVILWKQPAEIKTSVLSVAHHSNAELSNCCPAMAQNVYVTHSHIHINFNGSVHLSQQNINVEALHLKSMPKNSEFRQVWGKYLKGPNEIPMLTGINNILM